MSLPTRYALVLRGTSELLCMVCAYQLGGWWAVGCAFFALYAINIGRST